jgi:hypothetical protein
VGEYSSVSQSRLGSFVEAWTNIAIGFSINFTANWLILPRFGFHSLTLSKDFEIGLLFTVISLCRSYLLRRFYDKLRIFNASH